jgi:hypothetical protein
MVIVSDPRNCADDPNGDSDEGHGASYQDLLAQVAVRVDADLHDTEEQPENGGEGTSRVNASEMLKSRSACEAEPEGRPLRVLVSVGKAGKK